jgi:glycosyltransferase involved in cell wall biosynthesis
MRRSAEDELALSGCSRASRLITLRSVSGPLVSIVTPSYNQAEFLTETIESVLAQDYEPIEFIVVDGGSSDGSVEIIRRYADRLAWWRSEPDGGQVDALNTGLGRARGEILGWLCSDDTLLPGAVTCLVAELESHPAALIAYGHAVWTDEDSQPIGHPRSRPADLRAMARGGGQYVAQPASLWRRRAWERAGPLDERFEFVFDTLFFLKVAAEGEARLVDRELATHRLHPGAKTRRSDPRKVDEHVRVAREFYGGPLPARLRPHARVGAANAYRRAAWTAYHAGDGGRARRLALRSLFLSPRMSRQTARFVARAVVGARRA